MIRTKAYKFRLYPNESQKVLIAKTFGCVRWIWNNYTAEFNQYSENYKPVYKTPKELKQELFQFQIDTIEACGWVKKDLKLSDRTFHCSNCGFEMDRDINASNNILRVGVNALTNSRGDDVRPLVAIVCEAMRMN